MIRGQARAAGLVEDITSRRQAEIGAEALMARQKETLLREAHHRMKNSLQGVIGLLRRCAGQHPALESGLTAAISQVRSIAVIHELQSSRGGAPVPLGEMLGMQPDAQNAPTELIADIECAAPVAGIAPPPLAPPVLDLRIDAGTARAYRVKAGDYIQVIDVDGRQCSDFLAFDATALARGEEYDLDPTTTRTLMLFSIRGYLASLNDLATHPRWAKRLHRVLTTLPNELAEYKGLVRYRQTAIDWLAKFDDGADLGTGTQPE